ncbi:competence protein CoiA family protein [Clostridium pasteurianum]|uniref:competence protein CoiA family protein n=1 Tax=Clostridium pasteurianum TaxID=1501 RepID=UPI002260AFF5|nr:competence protein CoiA family protein [Clostridium pasteurianum]UZW12895.1 competence protein CoiA family protein [Clostridium pasteurianum]
MQKCRLNGEAVYAFKVKDENEIVDVEYEKMLRRASEKGQLKCEDCEADIIFKFGNIKIPHFAHKNDLLGGGCSYSRESEEHIQGKKLLLNLILKAYPDVEAEMRYRFYNGKRADLYFKFNDGHQLVIEFQRELNSLSYWEDKREFYQSINVTDLWIASGKIDEFENILREYEFIFQHRLFLNDNNNMLFVLDVERKELIIASKMVVNDEETNEIIMDRIFYKIYDINDIRILPNGTIDCEFDKEFKHSKDTFVQAYLQEKRRIKEEQERLRKELEERNKKMIEEQKGRYKEEQERVKQLIENINHINNNFEKTEGFSEIKYRRKGYGQLNYKQGSKKGYNDYVRNDDYYKDKVNKAISGHRYGIENLVRILVNGGSTEYVTIKELFEIEISKGNEKAKKVFDEVMKLSGLD